MKATPYLLVLLAAFPQAIWSQTDSISTTHSLKDVVIKASQGTKSKHRTSNTEIIGQEQLLKAACCNLGESFSTNPSVDVSYTDAATGAKQIKLLGLGGTYVQMLTENIPNLRGASIPYSLGYIPGRWMQSIQVSKGAASVKNGYESTTGQINIEFQKPQNPDGARGNVYYDSQTKVEANADANVHLNKRLSTSLLLHYENRQRDHDATKDGFMDMPKIQQYNLMHRWAYVSPGFISQLSTRLLRDQRQGGMSRHSASLMRTPHYDIDTKTDRYEAQWKNAILFQDEHNSSIALMLHGSYHDAEYTFGNSLYNAAQQNGYAQLMYETEITDRHNISTGVSFNHDHYKETVSESLPHEGNPTENTYGIYTQYTYKIDELLTVMPGLRWDYSSTYGAFLTPRLHIKYSPFTILTLRASAGKGYRSPHALAENAPLLASGRSFHISSPLKQEEAWNYGMSASLNISVAQKPLELNMEYYYTDFIRQMVINIDGNPGPHTVSFENLNGSSYSHTLQIDATYPCFERFSTTAAFRINDARTTYNGILRHRPLTSYYKGLLTMSYKTPMELWKFDITGHLNGKGRLYDNSCYPTFFQLQAQVTREFRHFTLYFGGENLTNYKMKQPIIGATDPWSSLFDATQIWGPTEGAMAYIGIRFKFEKQ